MGRESSDMVRFDLGLELLTCLLLVLEFWDVKLTCRKSWAGNLLMWSDLLWAPPSRSNEDSQT